MPDPKDFEIFMRPQYEKLCRAGKRNKAHTYLWELDPDPQIYFRVRLSRNQHRRKSNRPAVLQKDLSGGKTSLIGNLSSSGVMLTGTCEEIKAEARKCLERGIDILAPGCGIAPKTPIKNLRALVEARDAYYK